MNKTTAEKVMAARLVKEDSRLTFRYGNDGTMLKLR